MRFIEGQSRAQRTLFPESLDECVPPEHPVRVMDAFVEQLDLRDLSFAHAFPADTGRPPYDPADLLKLYLFGYFNRIRSSRALERECGRNVEVMWLLNRLVPDFKTIANFRRENAKALIEVCRHFVWTLKCLGLIGGELVAIDGTKFQAVASREGVLTAEQLAREKARLDQRIAAYLAELDRADAREVSMAVDPERVRAALEMLRSDRAKLLLREAAMRAEGRSQDVAGEPDARLMRTGDGTMKVAYNLQTAVDARHQLIVHHDLTSDPFDSRQLKPMSEAAKATLGQESLSVVADQGYSNGEQLAQLAEEGITPYVPPRRQGTRAENERYFPRSAFRYEPETDRYHCPAGERLHSVGLHQRDQLYQYTTSACRTCRLRDACTPGARRTLTRHRYEAQFEAAQQRLALRPEIMRRRAAIAEPPHAHLKYRVFGNGRFVLRGLGGARAEMAIGVIAYNMKRAINVLGAGRLQLALTA